jgi:predicted negative regulator of RcsB-dependent stress response
MPYETEEQQVEALKKWWKENGTSIIAGVVIGLAGVFGWRAWVAHRDTQAAQAANLFDRMVSAVDAGETQAAAQQAKVLNSQYGSTPYAAFSDLMEARSRYEHKDIAGAKAALERAMDTLPDETLRTIAVLRLARIEIGSKDLAAAAALLDRHPAPPPFAPEYAELRGDIAAGRGDLAAARTAYQQAIAGGAGNADLVQLKLDNLSPAS